MARNLVRFDPFAELDSLQSQLFNDGLFKGRRGMALPTTDVYMEGDNRLIVEAHLPNFSQDDVSVDVDRGALVIQAEKREREEDKGKKYVVRESSSSFYRRIMLPEEADEASINADFSKGVLRVTVPFQAAPEPTRIAINAEPAAAS